MLKRAYDAIKVNRKVLNQLKRHANGKGGNGKGSGHRDDHYDFQIPKNKARISDKDQEQGKECRPSNKTKECKYCKKWKSHTKNTDWIDQNM